MIFIFNPGTCEAILLEASVYCFPNFIQTILRENTHNTRTCARDCSSLEFGTLVSIIWDLPRRIWYSELYASVFLSKGSLLNNNIKCFFSTGRKRARCYTEFKLLHESLGVSDTVEYRHLLWTHWMNMTPRESAAFILVLFHCLTPANGKWSSFKSTISHLSYLCFELMTCSFRLLKTSEMLALW